MQANPARPRGFTIVEMLVVIGIIALLMGILVPALGGAKRRSQKTLELNNLRQVGLAWTMYSNNNKDSLLPGFLTTEVQQRWKVRYRYPTHDQIPEEIAAPWTWRLFGYLDSKHEVLHSYLREDRETQETTRALIDEAEWFSQTPAFGYNAFYMGGWWETTSVGGNVLPAPRFFAQSSYDSAGGGYTEGAGRKSLISRSIGSIRRSSELITFCSTSLPKSPTSLEGRGPGQYKKTDDILPGSHYAVPPTLADEPIWRMSLATDATDSYTIEVLGSGDTAAGPAPVGRYTGQVAALMADLHTEPLSPGDLTDMRRWIDTATEKDFSHDP